MKVFGKFVQGSNNDVYRTEAYIDLNPFHINNTYQLPVNNGQLNKNIIGTIFMFNPGGSKPKNKNTNNFGSGNYVELEKDATMKTIIELLCNSDYECGLIEIKNLFNLREPDSENLNYVNLIGEIQQQQQQQTNNPPPSHNITLYPKFQGNFVFFAWSLSLLGNLLKEANTQNPSATNAVNKYFQNIIKSAFDQEKKICYVTKETTSQRAEQYGHFYHPRWITNEVQKEAMKDALCKQLKVQWVKYTKL